MMAMIRLTTKTSTTIIIVGLLSLLLLLLWVSPLFPKKFDIENEVSWMSSWITNFLRNKAGGFNFKKSLHLNYGTTQNVFKDKSNVFPWWESSAKGKNITFSQFDKSRQNGNDAKPTKIHTDTKTEN